MTVEAAEVPALIDEIPLIAVLGAFARGRTLVRGAGELKHKESDRLQAVRRLLAGGGRQRGAGRGRLRGRGPAGAGTAEPWTRQATTASPWPPPCWAPASRGACAVRGFEAAAVSFPDFLATFRALGGRAE